jgi:hypothetical protein
MNGIGKLCCRWWHIDVGMLEPPSAVRLHSCVALWVTDTRGTVCYVRLHVECLGKQRSAKRNSALLRECSILWCCMTAGCFVILLGYFSLEISCRGTIPLTVVKMLHVALDRMQDGLHAARVLTEFPHIVSHSVVQNLLLNTMLLLSVQIQVNIIHTHLPFVLLIWGIL